MRIELLTWLFFWGAMLVIAIGVTASVSGQVRGLVYLGLLGVTVLGLLRVGWRKPRE